MFSALDPESPLLRKLGKISLGNNQKFSEKIRYKDSYHGFIGNSKCIEKPILNIKD